MMRFTSVAILLLVQSAAGVSLDKSKQLRHEGASFISSLKFKISLRICNAYPYARPMDVYLGKEKLTEAAMPYKECAEFSPPLKAGDKLDFKVGDTSAGTFSVSDLPQNDAVLVLVIHRHDVTSTAVSFESHVFASLVNAQVAVIDAYKGDAKGMMRIQDKKTGEKGDAALDRSEELRYDSVVALNQGSYEVELQDSKGAAVLKHDLVAVERESYLVIRCGVEAKTGPAFPQELMVFPHTPLSALGGAKAYSLFGAAFATLLALVTSF